jgi:hypothetical protein
MDASYILKQKQARMLAAIQNDPRASVQKGQVPNNPPLTPDQRAEILQAYPKSQFANTNNIYPCGTSTLCSTIYTAQYYYNSTN